jgi:hypothetical protein
MAQIDITAEGKGTFQMVLANAEAGDEILYHVGKNAAGAHKHDAFVAHQRGECLLYQRRLGESRFAYIARKTQP